MIDYLIIIQARLNSTRLPGKIFMTVGGIPMVKRVWLAAKEIENRLGKTKCKVIVGYPERYPDVDENNVLERFRRIVKEFPCRYVIRLTADCPLLTCQDIHNAIVEFEKTDKKYYNNGKDGYDVQIFNPWNCPYKFDSEHIIDAPCNIGGPSVNTKEDLKWVRLLAK